MRIVVDLQACQTASRERGIGRYSLALARSMAGAAGSHEMWLALNGGFPESTDQIRYEFRDLIAKERIAVFATPAPVAEIEPSNAWRSRAAEAIRETFLADLAPDIVHVSSLFEGLVDDATTSIGLQRHAHASAVTLYDLIPLLRPEVLPSAIANDWYGRKLESLKRSDILLAISNYARQEVTAELGVHADRVAVISTAASEHFRPLTFTQDEIASHRARFGLTKPFVLYAGGFDARKNVSNLIAAFGSLPLPMRADYQ